MDIYNIILTENTNIPHKIHTHILYATSSLEDARDTMEEYVEDTFVDIGKGKYGPNIIWGQKLKEYPFNQKDFDDYICASDGRFFAWKIDKVQIKIEVNISIPYEQ